MQTCWELLHSILSKANGATDASSLLKGAQQYLEQGHGAYMQRAIQADRAQVA